MTEFHYGVGSDGYGNPYPRNADGLVVAGGDTVFIGRGGTGYDILVESGGTVFVQSGGTATLTTVQDGGSIYVQDGGSTTSTTLTGGDAYEGVLSATVSSTTLLSGATEGVSDGAQAIGTVVGEGGFVLVAPAGRLTDAYVGAGGFVLNDGTASATSVGSGGEIYNERLDLDTEVFSGGTEIATAQGVSSSTVVSDGGTQVTLAFTGVFNVTAGTGEYASFVRNGSEIDEYSEGELTIVYTSGSDGVTATAFNDDGTTDTVTGPDVYNAFQPGSVVGTTVEEGGTIVLAGGSYSGLNVASGGVLRIGGSFNAFQDSNGNPGTGTTSGTPVYGLVVSAGDPIVVSSGGYVVGADVLAGGILALADVSVAATTTVEANGLLLVSSGGATSGDVLYGSETVLAGGRETVAQVQAGGVLQVLANATGSGAVLLTSGKEVVAGTATGNDIRAGAVVSVLSGGMTSLDGVSGFEVVAAGGSAGPLAVGSGGSLIVSGGASTQAQVQSGGRAGALAGGQLLSAAIAGGGLGIVSSGGAALSASVAAGGELAVFAGGGVQDTVLLTSGKLTVSGGLADTTQVASGAVVSVFAGGRTTGDGVSGFEVVAAGGSAGPLAVGSGGALLLSGGASTQASIQSGGKAGVYAGGTLDGATVQGGGLAVVSAGGSATMAEVASGGELAVFDGGSDFGATLDSGGKENVFGGTASATTIGVGALQNVSGGVASGSYVLGFQSVLSGGQAERSFVSAGGVLRASGGVAHGALVLAGGVAGAFVGGVLAQAEVDGSGLAVVSSGGTASGTNVLSGGQLAVFDSGTVVSSTVAAGAVVSVFGGVTTNDVVSGFEVVGGGAANSIVIQDGGVLRVSGGTVSNGFVESRGRAGVYGGTVLSSTVDAGGLLTISGGTASGTMVNAGGEMALFGGGTEAGGTLLLSGKETVFGGTASGTVVQSGAVQYVSGGVASAATVLGIQSVLSGGQSVSAQVGSGGSLLASGGVGSGAAVGSGGRAFAISGGTLSGATVDGLLTVSAGGTAGGTAVMSGGELAVFADGIAADTTVDEGGSAGFRSGGTASGLTVSSGGVAVLSAGGSYSGVMVAGGTVEAQSFADLSAVGFAGPGGVLQVDAGLQAQTAIAGFGEGDALDDMEIAFDPDATVSEQGDVVTINAGGMTFSADLVGTAGARFVLSAVTSNGTSYTRLTEGVACYAGGTAIATPGGEAAVETLRPGDLVLTHGGAARPVRWIGTRCYDNRFVADDPAIMPIRFAPGSLGQGLPRRALLVSPEHAMLLDGVLVPAKLLVNGEGITQVLGLDTIAYHHVELDSHDILLAEGAPSESFVDDDSRGMFHNAAEYRLLYGDAASGPARFCAPRVEDGEALDAIQRRLAGPPPAPAALRGFLDTAEPGGLTGWARDGAGPVRLRVLVDGIAVGTVVADEFRADLLAAGEGDGRHGFRFTLPHGLAGPRHAVSVQRASDGAELLNSPAMVAAVPSAAAEQAPLAGALDVATRDRLRGWACTAGCDAPVALQVLDNGVKLVRILANADRPDVRAAGHGSGRHGFDIAIPGGLSPLTRHVLEVRRESDGAPLPGAPAVIEAANSFDAALEGAVTRAVAGLDGADGDRVLSFLLAQTERLLQDRARDESGLARRDALRQFRRRWGRDAAAAEAPPSARALVIDGRLPEAARDAGSDAVLSHAAGLRTLGYAVSLVAADDLRTDSPALAAAGIACLGHPAYASVEDVLRRQADGFDVVYLHRAPVAARYLQLVRQYMPRARVLFSVADLHHLRVARQAALEGRPELQAASEGMRLLECTAAWSADAVLTHSAAEAALLRADVPGARVVVAPWAVPVAAPRRRPFEGRGGVAFIGNGTHAPNADAARWLVEEIMPLVWAERPEIECLLVGSEMPAAMQRLARPGVRVLGQVPALGPVLDAVRLTVAPLRFGAGVKGKVLASLAARTPCVMTPVAAEGLALTPALQACVAEGPAALARLILHLHADQRANHAAGRAGAALVRRDHSEAAMLDALAEAAGRPAHLVPRIRSGRA